MKPSILMLCLALCGCDKPAPSVSVPLPPPPRVKLFYAASALHHAEYAEDWARRDVAGIMKEMESQPPGGRLELLKVRLLDAREALKKAEVELARVQDGHKNGFYPAE